MAFDSLSEKLQEAFQSLKGKGKITEDDVNLALRQVRTALLLSLIHISEPTRRS